MGPPDGGRVHPDAPSPAAFAGADPPLKRRFRLRLAGGLVLVLAVSGAWSAAALHGQPPAASTLPTGSTSGRPPPSRPRPPPTPSGNCACSARSTGWAQRLIDGAVLHTTLGVLRWTVASPPTLRDGHRRLLRRCRDRAGAHRPRRGRGADHGPMRGRPATGAPPGAAEGGFAVLGFSPALLGALDFVDPLHGWFSELQDDPGVTGTAFYRTVDGGAHWCRSRSWAPPARRAPGTPGRPPPAVSSSRPPSSAPPPAGSPGPARRALHRSTSAMTAGPPGRPSRSHPSPAGLYGETSSPPSFTSAEGRHAGSPRTSGRRLVSAGLFATVDGGQTWALRYSACCDPVRLRLRRRRARLAGPTSLERRCRDSRPLLHRRRRSQLVDIVRLPAPSGGTSMWPEPRLPQRRVGWASTEINRVQLEAPATCWRPWTAATAGPRCVPSSRPYPRRCGPGPAPVGARGAIHEPPALPHRAVLRFRGTY